MSHPVGSSRHYGLDWLRIAAFALLIVYHIGMYFLPWPWHINRTEPAAWLAAPMLALNSWRLPLLFVVSGYASAAILVKNNLSLPIFLKQRSVRLLVPVLAAILFIIPPQPWIELVTKSGYSGTFWQFWTGEYWSFSSGFGMFLPTWQHLWFVVYLWAYTAVLAMSICLISRSIRMSAHAIADRFLSGPCIVIIPAALAVTLVLCLGAETVRLDAWVSGWAAHAVFFLSFLFGYYLFAAKDGWRAIKRCWPMALGIAVICYSVLIGVKFAFQGSTEPSWAVYVFAIARPIHGWTTIVALIGIADRFCNHDHPWRATLSEAVFPFYIIHQTIIVIAAYAIADYMFSIPIEFAILLAATMMGCWMFYRVGRRVRWLRPLIGLKL